MPKRRHIRQKTGNHRKVPMRRCQEQYRWKRGLTSLDISLRNAFQSQIVYTMRFQQDITNQTAELLAEAEMALNPAEEEELVREAEVLHGINCTVLNPVCDYYFDREMQLCDILPENDAADHDFGEDRNRRIHDMTDYDARRFTRFSKLELRRILHMFKIPLQVHIRCASTQNNYYKFTGEEIFLFGMTKLATGEDNDSLCISKFGGSPRRWSGAYKWFLYHIYDRYYPVVLGIQGLLRVRHRFPLFAQKMAKKFNQERYYVHPETHEQINIESTTVDIEDFAIALLGDSSVYETCTMGSGPAGDYAHTMRNLDWYLHQRAIYSGYKKLHGLVVLSLMSPDGLNYIYAPCSMRQSDAALMQMSRLPEYLEEIQEGFFPDGRIYAAYLDRIFQPPRCICVAHKGDNLNPLTHEETLQNSGMNAIHEPIEHAVVANEFRMCTNYEQFKLMQNRPHAMEQLAACYLLTNIKICLHGSQVGGLRTFNLVPPQLEDYLRLGDEGEPIY